MRLALLFILIAVPFTARAGGDENEIYNGPTISGEGDPRMAETCRAADINASPTVTTYVKVPGNEAESGKQIPTNDVCPAGPAF